MEQARDLGEALADRRARLEEVGVGDRRTGRSLIAAQLPGLWVAAQVGEAQIRVGGGEVDVGVELEQVGEVDRAALALRLRRRCVPWASRITSPISDWSETVVKSPVSTKTVTSGTPREPGGDHAALLLDVPDEPSGLRRARR